MADLEMRKGQRVEARFGGGDQWFPGIISQEWQDGNFAVDYDDGDQEHQVPPEHIRPLDPAGDPLASEAALVEAQTEISRLKATMREMVAVSEEEDAETHRIIQRLEEQISEHERSGAEKGSNLAAARRTILTLEGRIEELEISTTTLRKAEKQQAQALARAQEQVLLLSAQTPCLIKRLNSYCSPACVGAHRPVCWLCGFRWRGWL